MQEVCSVGQVMPRQAVRYWFVLMLSGLIQTRPRQSTYLCHHRAKNRLPSAWSSFKTNQTHRSTQKLRLYCCRRWFRNHRESIARSNITGRLRRGSLLPRCHCDVIDVLAFHWPSIIFPSGIEHRDLFIPCRLKTVHFCKVCPSLAGIVSNIPHRHGRGMMLAIQLRQTETEVPSPLDHCKDNGPESSRFWRFRWSHLLV